MTKFKTLTTDGKTKEGQSTSHLTVIGRSKEQNRHADSKLPKLRNQEKCQHIIIQILQFLIRWDGTERRRKINQLFGNYPRNITSNVGFTHATTMQGNDTFELGTKQPFTSLKLKMNREIFLFCSRLCFSVKYLLVDPL